MGSRSTTRSTTPRASCPCRQRSRATCWPWIPPAKRAWGLSPPAKPMPRGGPCGVQSCPPPLGSTTSALLRPPPLLSLHPSSPPHPSVPPSPDGLCGRKNVWHPPALENTSNTETVFQSCNHHPRTLPALLPHTLVPCGCCVTPPKSSPSLTSLSPGKFLGGTPAGKRLRCSGVWLWPKFESAGVSTCVRLEVLRACSCPAHVCISVSHMTCVHARAGGVRCDVHQSVICATGPPGGSSLQCERRLVMESKERLARKYGAGLKADGL